MKFRSKPFIIEAHQWFKNGDHPLDGVGETFPDPLYPELTAVRMEGALVRYFRHPAFPGNSACADCNQLYHDHGYIDTAQGGHKVCPGDWIIPESKSPGMFYPCKPGVFAEKYEAVEEDAIVGLTCGAEANIRMRNHVCDLPAGHEGEHQCAGVSACNTTWSSEDGK